MVIYVNNLIETELILSSKLPPKDIIINEENYVDKDNNIVKLVYLKTDLESIYLIDNYILTAKIEKEDKMIISYILDYIKGEYNA